MSRAFADPWVIGSRSATVIRPWPGRALEIQQTYQRQIAAVRETAAAIPGAADAPRLHARLLAQRDAASGYLVAALVADPAPPAAEPDERPATHWRRVWRFLEDSGWTADEAHALVTLLELAVLQGLRHAPSAVAYRLAEGWASPAGTLDYILAKAGDKLLGDPAAVTRRRTEPDQPTAWERLDPDLREATVAMLIAEVRRG